MIRWIQRILRSAFASGAIWLVALSAGSVPITLVNGVITARGLGPASRGDYSAIVGFTTVLTFVACAGISELMIMRSASDREADYHPTIGWMHSLSLGVLFSVPAVWYSANLRQDDISVLLLVATLPLVGVVGTLAVSQLIASGEVRSASLIGAIPYVAQLTAFVLLFETGHVEYQTVLLAYWLSSALAGLVGYLILSRQRSDRFVFDRAHIDAFYRRLRSLGGSQVVRSISSRADLIVTGILLTSADTGIYSVAMAPVMAGTAIVSSLSPLVLKRAHGGDSKLASVSVLFALLVAAGLSTVAPFLVTVLYGDDYARASSLLIPLSLGLVANVVFDVVLRLTQAEGRAEIGFVGTLVSLIAQVVGLIGLGFWLGLPGIALGSAIGYGAGAMFLLRNSPSFLKLLSPLAGMNVVLAITRRPVANR